jgi:hypothetical protein
VTNTISRKGEDCFIANRISAHATNQLNSFAVLNKPTGNAYSEAAREVSTSRVTLCGWAPNDHDHALAAH